MAYPTLDAERLKALSHPLRVQLLNALGTYGPATASQLGERFGESSGATSYHLRQLERHGFVREDADRGSARERWWERVPGPISFDPREYEEGSAERGAADSVLAEWQRDRIRILGDYLALGPTTLPEEWGDASAIASSTLNLSLEQTNELSRAFEAVLDDFIRRFRGQEGPGLRRIRIDYNAFPIIDRGRRPPRPEGGDR